MLKRLDLAGNKISFTYQNGNVQENFFQGLAKLETLNIQYNPIYYLPQRFFQDLVNLSEIGISDSQRDLLIFITKNIKIKRY